MFRMHYTHIIIAVTFLLFALLGVLLFAPSYLAVFLITTVVPILVGLQTYMVLKAKSPAASEKQGEWYENH